MKIKHNPLYNIEQVEKVYTERDGVQVKYVCTTDLRNSDVPADIFYRATPHPTFGNRYFGLFVNPFTGNNVITNADIVEEFEFGCVENDNGELEYSESHHEYKSFNNGNMIDGGRQYIRSSATGARVYVVKDGEMVEV